MCDSLCTEVGKSPLDIHHYRGRKNCNVLNVDNNGRTAKKRLAELVNALNLALTFGADQPMLYTYNSFYRKYSYIRILYFVFFFSYMLFSQFCAATGGGHWGTLETAKPKKKIIQNRKTAKKFGQNRKPHTKPSKTDTVVTSGAYRAN